MTLFKKWRPFCVHTSSTKELSIQVCEMTAKWLHIFTPYPPSTHTHTHTHTHCKLLPFSSQENHLPLCMSAIRSSFVSLIIVPFFPFWICDPSFLSVLARRFFTDLLASLVTWGEWAMINCFVSLDLRDIIIQALAAFVCYPDSLEAVENMSETLWVTFWSFFRKRNLLAPPYC